MQIRPRVTHMLPSSNERSCPHLHSLQVIGLNALNCWCAGREWISDQEFNPKVKLIGSPSVTAGLYLFNHHQFATCGNSVVASRNNSESFSTVAAAFEGFCLLLLCFLFSPQSDLIHLVFPPYSHNIWFPLVSPSLILLTAAFLRLMN